MSQVRDQRFPVRLFNRAQRFVEKLGKKPTLFVEAGDDLKESARKAVGFDDFGGDPWQDGFQTLLQAYDEESQLNPFGRVMVKSELTTILKNRLRVEKAFSQNPALRQAAIKRPIFVLGLPRTGTTALHNLLAQDPSNQVLEYWINNAPGPRPPRDAWENDPRYKEAVQGLKVMYWLDPGLKAIHLLTPEGPEECRQLLQQSFTDDTFDCNASIPSYSAWYARRDMTPSYERHRELLKIIGANSPERRWCLKYPAHMRHLRALLKTYPDACIVQTHRDPGRVLPSLCSLIAGWRGIYEDHPDRMNIGSVQLETWAGALESALAVRKEFPEAQFYDLHFQEIVSDPAAAATKMYHHFGFDFDREAEERLRTWHRENPQHKHGEHRYRAEDFGLSPQRMADRFSAYIEHFQVPSETLP